MMENILSGSSSIDLDKLPVQTDQSLVITEDKENIIDVGI